MKNDLTCAVVRDLLPSYVEGLTETETNEAVERHLEGCPQCRRLRYAMSLDAQTDAREEKEVDYLKQVKRQGKRRTARAVLLTLMIVGLIFSGIALELFVVGEEATSEGMSWSIQQDGNSLHVRAYTVWSGVAYCRWETEQVGDTVYIRTTKVLPSYLYPTADNRMRIPLKGVKNIYLADRLIWSEGETIDTRILKLLEHKTEYTGDAPALGRLCGTLGVGDLGQYTMELSTAQPPYRLTLIFTSGESAVIHDKMSEYAMYLLALVDNLEEVAWEAPDGTKGLWDVESLDRYLKNDPLESYALLYGEDLNFPESIKDCGTAGGLAKLEKLLEHPEHTPVFSG